MSQPAKRLFTVDEFEAMGQAGILASDDRVELIEGEVITMSPIGSRHASAVGVFTEVLVRALARRATVWTQSPVVLGDMSEPQPDVLVLRPRDDQYRDALPSADDVLLIVEVADASLAHDRRQKLPLYARWRVPEAWLADVISGTISVHRDPTPDGYRVLETFGRGAVVSPNAFPDLSVAVQDVFGPGS